jgi:hypothetical protein
MIKLTLQLWCLKMPTSGHKNSDVCSIAVNICLDSVDNFSCSGITSREAV